MVGLPRCELVHEAMSSTAARAAIPNSTYHFRRSVTRGPKPRFTLTFCYHATSSIPSVTSYRSAIHAEDAAETEQSCLSTAWLLDLLEFSSFLAGRTRPTGVYMIFKPGAES